MRNTIALTALLVVVTLTSGCGGFRKEARSLESTTGLLIFSEDLVGATVTVDGGPPKTISRKDLRKYEVGLLGVKDSTEERMDTVFLEVEPGKHTFSLSTPSGKTKIEMMYFSADQIRKWTIK